MVRREQRVGVLDPWATATRSRHAERTRSGKAARGGGSRGSSRARADQAQATCHLLCTCPLWCSSTPANDKLKLPEALSIISLVSRCEVRSDHEGIPFVERSSALLVRPPHTATTANRISTASQKGTASFSELNQVCRHPRATVDLTSARDGYSCPNDGQGVWWLHIALIRWPPAVERG